MTRVAAILMAVQLYASAMHSGDLFTSSANIHSLFRVEKRMAAVLKDFVAAREKELLQLKQLADEFAATRVPPRDDYLDPSQSFNVIKRLVNFG